MALGTAEIVRDNTEKPSADALLLTRDLHSFVKEYERAYPDEVLHIEKPVDAKWGITALTMKLERAKRFPLLVFHNVLIDGKRMEMPLMTFMMASRLRLARAMGVTVEQAGVDCFERVQRRIKPVVVSRSEAPVKQIVEKGAEVDVRRFPAPHHHSMDPGRYITEGLFLTFNRASHQDNSAYHRGWLAGRDEIRVLLGPHSHNAYNLREYEAAGEDMPAAYWIGHHPLVLLGAENHIGPDESHYETAGGTLGSAMRLVPSETLGDDFLVPADAEVVIEGYVPRNERKPEGPFGEFTRYVGPQRWGPVLKVTAVTRRRDAYWDDVMVGHTHWLSSLTKEGDVLRAVRKLVPGARAVHVPMTGCGVMHVYLQIKKTLEDHGRAAAVAAFGSSPGIKHVFVFDEDVDIFNEKEVLLNLATRFQADRGLIVIEDMIGTALDPSSPGKIRTAKVAFDCTKPLGVSFAERLSIPKEVLDKMDPLEIVGQARLDKIPVEPWG
ncbi:MAG TPA: UbiD family decarboxylase [Candidatus Binatia bacterium]